MCFVVHYCLHVFDKSFDVHPAAPTFSDNRDNHVQFHLIERSKTLSPSDVDGTRLLTVDEATNNSW